MKAQFRINANTSLIKRRKTGFDYSLKKILYKIDSCVKRPVATTKESGILIKENSKTVLVYFNGSLIKRHKVKHAVELG